MAAYVGCPTCGHPIAIHGRGAGACRINGCSCPEYGPFYVGDRGPETVIPAQTGSRPARGGVEEIVGWLALFIAVLCGFAVGIAIGAWVL